MALSQEQIKELKDQLRQQINHLPDDQKQAAEKQIEELSTDALESMVAQQQSQASQKIFRSIITGKIPSKKLDENLQAIAVLEIMPIEKGHVIIIPKEPVLDPKDMPPQALTLAKKIGKKISSKLKPKSVEIMAETKFQEVIINVVPVYKDSVSLKSKRKKASEDELFEIHTLLKTKPKTTVRKVKKKITLEAKKIKRRIA